MRYTYDELGVSFDVPSMDFISLNDKGKKKFFKLSDKMLAATLFIFVEAKNDALTGRYFHITRDWGKYVTAEEIDEGVKTNITTLLKAVPELNLVENTKLSPQNVTKLVFMRPNGTLFSQYFVAKNGCLFCISADISKSHDDIDDLMANVAMSASSTLDSAEQKILQNSELMRDISIEANRLHNEGLTKQEAVRKALEKYGIKVSPKKK